MVGRKQWQQQLYFGRPPCSGAFHQIQFEQKLLLNLVVKFCIRNLISNRIQVISAFIPNDFRKPNTFFRV